MKAQLEFNFSGELPDFRQLMASFPELSARILGYVGKQAATQLFEEHLQGQDIDVQNFYYGSTGMPRGAGGILRRRYAPIDPGLEKLDRSIGVQRKRQSTEMYRTRAGRPLVFYEIGKGLKHVRVGSSVLNLFENGRKLRGGGFEAGRGILKKFKANLSGRLQEYINEAERVVLKNGWWKEGEYEGELEAWNIDTRLIQGSGDGRGVKIL
jgi:hypothetical protein